MSETINQGFAGLRKLDHQVLYVRGQRVWLEKDLAVVFGVSVGELKKQFKRNRSRFPADFAFRLTQAESLAAQSAELETDEQKTLCQSWAFTESGLLMLANLLNTPAAIEISVGMIRAFYRLREMPDLRCGFSEFQSSEVFRLFSDQ